MQQLFESSEQKNNIGFLSYVIIQIGINKKTRFVAGFFSISEITYTNS